MMKSKLVEFGNVSSFHGPNHANESTNTAEKTAWYFLFICGAILASIQSAGVLRSYFLDESNLYQKTTQVSYMTEEYRQAPLTICRKSWIDFEKVRKDEGIPVRHILFALSLIVDNDQFILDQIASELDPPDSERIWGLPMKSCDPSIQQATVPPPVPFDTVLTPAAPEESLPLPQLIRKKRQVAPGDNDLAQILEGITQLLCPGNCAVDLDSMNNWQAHAESFASYMAQQGHETLDQFLESFASNGSIFTKDGVWERTGWRVMGEGLCETGLVNVPILLNNASQGEQVVVNLEVEVSGGRLADALKDPKKAVEEAAVQLIPSVAETVLDKSLLDLELPVNLMSKMKNAWDPAEAMQSFRQGKVPLIAISITKQVHRKRTIGQCRASPEHHRVPKGYSHTLCGLECRYEQEKLIGDQYNCTVVTKAFTDKIPVQQKLCPRRFVPISVSEAKLQQCKDEKGCDKATNTFCDEWESEIEMTQESETLKSKNGACDPNLLSKMRISITVPQVTVSEEAGMYNINDVVGMVGGLLGLYVGSSLLTIIHCVLFWIKAMCTYRRPTGSDMEKTKIAG